jgi:hypothetical protein
METERPDAHWAPPSPAWPAPAAGGLALPAGAPRPPALSPRGRRRRGRLLAGALLCTVLAALLGSLALGQYRVDRQPGTAVSRYFAALSAGNAPAALALAVAVPPSPYLTSAVLRQQLSIARMTDVVVGDTVRHGSNATTQVSYRLVFGSTSSPVQDAVDLVRAGSSWRLTRAATDIHLSAIGAGTNRLTFAGRPLPTGVVRVFPGALPVGTDYPAVQPAARPLIRLIDEDQDTQLNVVLSADARRQLGASLSRALTACLTGASKDPRCPQPTVSRPVPGSLRATVDQARSGPLSITLSTASDGLIELAERVSVHGSWRTWDFNNQQVLRSGRAELAVQAQASVADLNTVYWDPP